jgi:hypothetical protein
MNAVAAFATWCAPLLLGSGIYVLLAGWPHRRSDAALAVGGGWMLGVLLCGLLARTLAASDLAHVLMRVAPWALLIGAAAWGVAWWRRGDLPALAESSRSDKRWFVFALIVLVLLGWRGWLLASDILLHPTLPWDAWAAWQAKAHAWVLASHAVPFVSFNDWLLHPQEEWRTSVASSYPDLLPWAIVWFAGAFGWVEPWINCAWFGLWVALLIAHYGQWRALDIAPAQAWVGVYLLGSLPLLDAHVALAGYADLWVAALFSLAGLAWLRWRCHREPRQLGIVFAVMVLLPMLKLEGAVWSIVLGAACVIGVLPAHMRRRRFLVAFAIAMVPIAFSLCFGVAWVSIARRYIEGGASFSVTGTLDSLVALGHALWAQWNWNLLWFVLPAVLVWNRSVWIRSTSTRRLAALVAAPFVLIAGLFVFTSASRYAQSYSAINRLLLQITPLLVSLLIFAIDPPDVSSDTAASDRADQPSSGAGGGSAATALR